MNVDEPATAVRPRRGVSAVGLAVVGAIVGGVTGLGGGASPVLHIVLGMLATPLLDLLVRYGRPRRGVLAQLAVLAVVGAASAGLNRTTARPNAAVAFEQAFGAPPPTGVTLLSAKRRWFDGQITAFRFRADATAIATAVARRPFIAGEPDMAVKVYDPAERPEAWKLRWQSTFGTAALADRSWWNDVPDIADPRSYGWDGGWESTVLVWDPSSGEAYAMHLTGQDG